MNKMKRPYPTGNVGRYLLLMGVIGLLLTSCDQASLVMGTEVPPPLTAREAYLSALDSNGLANTQMAKMWKLAGVNALKDRILLEAPFQETGYFRAEDPEALAYRIDLKTGELLQFNLVTEPDSILFFVDLFRIEATDSTTNFRHLFDAQNYQTDSLTYEAEQPGTYLLRIQPELLVSGRFTLKLIVQPVYGVFPVSGKGNRDVWSFFGDPRDGGKRKHKGVDIFARRGTPVVAAVDGTVRRVRDRGLGGKQVWLNDHQRRQSLYYAHLDSQLVIEGQRVKAGDTLGLVGNTGNARNTRPHLHFSIYRRGFGAIDPHPFIASQVAKVPTVSADTARLGDWVRVRRRNTQLLVAPQPGSNQLTTLDRHLPLEIIAASKFWYRVRIPEGGSGYLPVNRVEDLSRTISKITITDSRELLESPFPEAVPVSVVADSTEVEVIGISGSYSLVKDNSGTLAWMSTAER